MFSGNTYTMARQRIFTPAVVGVCILLIACFVAYLFAPDTTSAALALSTTSLQSGKIWTLLTYSLVNTCPTALIMNCLVILFIGSAVENHWRPAAWLKLWAVVSISVGLLYLAAGAMLGNNVLLMGSGSCVFGLIGTYGLLFRHNQSFLLFGTIKAHHAALLMIAVGILMSLSQPLSLISVLGAAVAYGYIKLLWFISQRNANDQFKGPAKKPGAFVDVD